MWPYLQVLVPLCAVGLAGALYWRRFIHLRTLKISRISSWCSCQTNRLQTICSKRRTSVFGALGPIRTREFELEALGNEFMVKAVELDIKLQKIANGNYTASSPTRV